MSKKPSDGDQQDGHEWPLAPEIEQPPPGKYVVAYRRATLSKRMPDRDTMELHFTIVDPPEWLDFPLIMYCPIPRGESVGKRSKYYELWCLANGGPPARKSRMTPTVFKGGYWLAEVRYTRRRMVKNGMRLLAPTETATAVIETLIERAAGGLTE